jgi:putative ATP-dependent endonuclease of OLD family
MDIDLVGSETAKNILFDIMNVPTDKRTTLEILVNRQKQLKRQESVLGATRNLGTRGLPNSYKLIRRSLPEMVRKSMP